MASITTKLQNMGKNFHQADEIPDKIANGVAISPNPRAKWPTMSDTCEIFSDVKKLKLCIALSKKQTPAMANEPTTNSVVIT